MTGGMGTDFRNRVRSGREQQALRDEPMGACALCGDLVREDESTEQVARSSVTGAVISRTLLCLTCALGGRRFA